MSKPNLSGSSFLSLNLDKKEEAELKLLLKQKDMSANRLLRALVRRFLKEKSI